METSVFIAKILGPYFVIIALGMLINQAFYLKVMEDYCKNAALILFTGIFAFVFGMVMVLVHNVWVTGWPVLITFFGWSGLVKGIWIIGFPETICRFMKMYIQNKRLLTAHSVLALVLGSTVTVCGYFLG